MPRDQRPRRSVGTGSVGFCGAGGVCKRRGSGGTVYIMIWKLDLFGYIYINN